MKMIDCRKSLMVCIGLLMCGTFSAQESEFDLASQRSEAQDVFAVPGKKLDHKGIIINPTGSRPNREARYFGWSVSKR